MTTDELKQKIRQTLTLNPDKKITPAELEDVMIDMVDNQPMQESVIKKELFFDDGSGEVVPVKHPDLSTQPSILPYKFAGNYVYEQMVWVDGSRFTGDVREIDLIRFKDYNLEGKNNIILGHHSFVVGDTINGNYSVSDNAWYNFVMMSDDERIFIRRIASTLPVCKGVWVRVVWTTGPNAGEYYYVAQDKLTFTDYTNGRITYLYEDNGGRYYSESGKIVIDSKGRELLLQGGWLKWYGSGEEGAVCIFYNGNKRYWYKDQALYLSLPEDGGQGGLSLGSIIGSTIEEFIAGTYSVEIIQ